MFKYWVLASFILALGFAGCLRQSAVVSGDGGVPAGAIMSFGHANGTGENGCPQGWIDANGTARATATYPNLDAAFATTWGARSGGNFSIPDLNSAGRYLRGGTAGTLQAEGTKINGITAMLTSGTLVGGTTSNPGNHTHADGALVSTGTKNVAAGAAYVIGDQISGPGGAHAHTVSGSVATGITLGGDAETRPITAVVKYCIKI